MARIRYIKSNHWRETEKFTWDNMAKHCWVMSTNCLSLKFVDNAQQCFALTTQANFPANNLNFHWRWRWLDQIQATFSTLPCNIWYLGAFLDVIYGRMYSFSLYVNHNGEIGVRERLKWSFWPSSTFEIQMSATFCEKEKHRKSLGILNWHFGSYMVYK